MSSNFNWQLAGVVAVGIVLVFTLTSMANHEKAETKYRKEHPALHVMPNVERGAIFGERKPTEAHGMQWHHTWRFPRADQGGFTFRANFNGGLLIGLSRGMSDNARGYLVQLEVPKGGSQTAGVSLLDEPDVLKVAHSNFELVKYGYYYLVYNHGHIVFGSGQDPRDEESILFEMDVPQDKTVHEWQTCPTV